MIFNVIGLVVGLLILEAGLFYLAKEKDDLESKKIYGVISAIGIIITIGMIIKMVI